MSYNKVTATIDYIKFYYDWDDIFGRAKLESQYRARTMENFEDYLISDDDEDAFDHHIKDAIFDIGKVIIKLTKGLTNAIFHTLGHLEQCGFYVLDYDQFNDNLLDLVDKEIEKMLTWYCLYKWYQHCGLDNEYKLNYTDYLNGEVELTNMIFELWKPTLSSTPSLSTPSTTSNIISVAVTSIPADTLTRIDHTFGSGTYTVSAFDSSGYAIPGFDNIIENRESTYMNVYSTIAYSNVTLIISGVI